MKNSAPLEIQTAYDGTVLWCWQQVVNLHGGRAERRRESSKQGWKMLGDLGRGIWAGGNIETIREASGRPFVVCNGVTHCASISHSRDLVAVAISSGPGGMIGIDIEYRDPTRDIDALSRWLFDGDANGRDFYQGWCDYEAAFKATGQTDPIAQSQARLIALTTTDEFSGSLARI